MSSRALLLAEIEDRRLAKVEKSPDWQVEEFVSDPEPGEHNPYDSLPADRRAARRPSVKERVRAKP